MALEVFFVCLRVFCKVLQEHYPSLLSKAAAIVCLQFSPLKG